MPKIHKYLKSNGQRTFKPITSALLSIPKENRTTDNRKPQCIYISQHHGYNFEEHYSKNGSTQEPPVSLLCCFFPDCYWKYSPKIEGNKRFVSPSVQICEVLFSLIPLVISNTKSQGNHKIVLFSQVFFFFFFHFNWEETSNPTDTLENSTINTPVPFT